MGLFSAIQSTTSGLSAQRTRMDVVGNNVANMDTTRAADGEGAYRRQLVHFVEGGSNQPFARVMQRISGASADNGVVLTQVAEDNETPMRQVFDPSHPDADEEGYVEFPNVDLVSEMTDLTSANRSYQANATVLDSLKQTALRALDIGNR